MVTVIDSMIIIAMMTIIYSIQRSKTASCKTTTISYYHYKSNFFLCNRYYGLILNLASTALVAILSELLTVSINSIIKFILSTQPPRFDLMRDVMK